ncbi:MAG TPA: sensor histidine kinase [Spirochaetia bacterium]|nr:sensor histidine kinase [Spirochaetia bacterium]
MRRFLRYRSIRVKLLIYFVAVIVLPLLTLGILGPYISARIIEREVTNHTVQLIRQVTRNIEFYIREMEGIISILAEDADIQAFYGIGDTGGLFSRAHETGALRLLANITHVNTEIAGILLVNDADQHLSNEIQPITRDPLAEEEWYRRAVHSAPAVQLLPRPVGRNLRNTPGYSADDVVSIVKAVVDPRTGRARGVVLIDMKLQVVQDIFIDMKVGQGGFLFIEDAEGGTVYSPVNPVVYRVRGEWLAGPKTSTVRRIGGADYQIIAQGSEYTGWKTIGVFPLNEIMGQVSLIRYYSFIIAGVTLFIAVVVSIFFTGSIARPVIALRTLMKKAEEGNLTVRFQGGQEDEIGHLGKSFNTMIEEIQKLIDLVYREQQSKREAELKTLQEQIKPHFLYNTLDTIHWMAQDHGATDIVQIVTALTSLFRIALSKGKEMISLSDELEHVRSYLIIQKLRYEDKFDFSLCVQDDVLPYMVLKLTLQPIVENAIYHGIKERRGHGTIRVDALRRDGILVLRVCDDGVGMSSDKLAAVRALLTAAPAESTQKNGYGISNVNERIQLSFGKDYGLRFESAPGRGTTVEILHPLIAGEEKDVHVESADRRR